MKVVIDMNSSSKWVAALKDAGIEAEHWSAVGDVMAGDDHIVEYAARNGRVVLTRDLDFVNILAAGGLNSPSVLLLRETDRFKPITVTRVITALRGLSAELEAGAIVSLTAHRLRVRRLPIGRIEGPQ